MPLTEGHAQLLLASTFNWFHNRIFPNVHFRECEMDLAVVTRARRLWEIEIKLTASDWRADEHKRKWAGTSRRYISRFFYAVPAELAENIPAFVPSTTGIIVLGDWYAPTVRPAKLMQAEKITDDQMWRLYESTYNRFWRQRFHRYTDAKNRLARENLGI